MFIEDDFHQIVDNIPALVFTMTPSCQLESVNQQVLDYFGRTVEELKNWDKIGAVHPDDLPVVYASLRRTLEFEEPHEVQQRLRRHDGVYRWFQPRARALRNQNGALLRWYSVLTDIEDLKLAEQNLRMREADFREIIDSVPGMVWCASSDGALTYVNERVLDYTGIGVEALLHDGWVRFLHPDDVDSTIQAWRQAVSSGRPHDVQYRLKRFDGVYRWFHVLGQAIRTENCEVGRWYGLLIDIDDRKTVEETLRRAEEKLSHAVQVAAAGELSASIAHEVNQPLAAVVANGHACLRWLAAQPPNLDRAREATERILRDANEAGAVVQRVRTLFKKAAIDKSVIDLNGIIQEVVDLIDREIRRKGVTVTVNLASHSLPILADPVQLQQLLLNLYLNGIEAMDSVRDRAKALSISAERGGPAQALVRIEDSGVGLPDPQKAFEAFYTTKQNGMGMGLVICRSIVEAHDGRIWATAGRNHGAILCFELPLFQPTCR